VLEPRCQNNQNRYQSPSLFDPKRRCRQFQVSCESTISLWKYSLRFLEISHKDRFSEDSERYARFLKAFTEIYGNSAPDRSYKARIVLIWAEMKDNVFEALKEIDVIFESSVPEIEPGIAADEEYEK
jgi:hypothetical protein